MFNDGSAKKLMIVCTKETQKYGAYLMQLIGSKCDKGDTAVGLKDGSVEAVLWSEANYEANRPTLPSSAYVLFIGDSKPINAEASNMNKIFEKYGMKFSALGTRAAMSIDKKPLNKEEYEKFLAFSSKYGKEYERKAKLNPVNTANTSALLLATSCLLAPVAIYGLVSGKKEREALNDQRYSCLTLYSYMELLPKFFED